MKETIFRSSVSVAIISIVLLIGCQTGGNSNQAGSEGRTIDVGGKYPWETEQPSTLIEQVNDGETIFLLSDGEALINEIQELAKSDEEKKKKFSASWAKYLEGYILQMEDTELEKEEYFNSLKELHNDLESMNYEDIAAEIDRLDSLK
ncbi:hypothetical protein SAMN04487936_102561 [Halobacillus dabanensis]|uniref:Uncharacterized protein n=1 Tax=Halobacillus dabanensis TaxID=240302 RepID=A0A1I3S8A3_HALDA|nr:hypothetical protein [Halobacillus dabanensis]SFJ55044.1 hypothetical protein SAMN04487936_102561 [Halobacillus dabanensis]